MANLESKNAYKLCFIRFEMNRVSHPFKDTFRLSRERGRRKGGKWEWRAVETAIAMIVACDRVGSQYSQNQLVIENCTNNYLTPPLGWDTARIRSIRLHKITTRHRAFLPYALAPTQTHNVT